ncbi:MAG: ABC transporter permease [Chloroflexi bacterium]|nr:ABC transporter permease [Chloroflexota bacterium]
MPRSPQLVAGGLVVVTLVTVAVLAPVIMPYPYDGQELTNRLLPPVWDEGGSVRHLLGTDNLGRDVLSRIIYGTRVSLVVGVLSVLVSGAIGIPLGIAAGYRGGLVDAVVMRAADMQFAFPYILLAIAFIAFWGSGLSQTITALGLAGWMVTARTTRGSTLSIREQDFILAAKAVGSSGFRIGVRHIFPNLLAPLLVVVTVQVPGRILAEATLSFLGLGIRPPMPSWGVLLSENRGYLVIRPWLVALPGLAIMIAALAVNQLGDGLRDVLDPRLRGRR